MEDHFHLGVKGLICNSDGEILLLQVNTDKFKGPCQPHWDIPGGRVQKGEEALDTLKREIEEETGLKDFICISPFMTVISNLRIPTASGDVGLILSVYQCSVSNTSPSILLSDEHKLFNWFSPRKAAELLKVKYPSEFTDVLQKH